MTPSQRATTPFRLTLLASVSLFVSSCEKHESDLPATPTAKKNFPSRLDLETDDNGIVHLKNDPKPFTGSVVHRNKDYRVTYFANYEDGRKHGPEIRYHEDGRLYRINDYHAGEQIHQREWHKNGVRKLDAMMKDGKAHGRHLRWHESGNVFWDGAFIDGFRWHGRILDLNDDGSVVWDAEFDNGKFLSGIYPAFMQPQLLKSGDLKPEDAVFSEEEIAVSLEAHEATEAARKAEKATQEAEKK